MTTISGHKAAGHDPVAPGGLGGIQRLVGAAQQSLPVLGAMQLAATHANAHRGGDGAALARTGALGHGAAQGFGQLGGGLLRGVGQQHQEFLATVAPHHVLGAQPGAEQARHMAQDLVAHLVAMAVVDGLEMVYVHHHQRIGFMRACGNSHVTARRQQQGAAVEQAGQLVGMAFQVRDDILDLTASFEELGKTPQKDLAADKATYPSLLGLEQSKTMLDQLLNQAQAIFQTLEEAHSFDQTKVVAFIERLRLNG